MTPVMCIALAVYFEARSEPVAGQIAVASVVMERVMSPRYPDNACDVVFQHKQFSAFNNGVPEVTDQDAFDTSVDVAQYTMINPQEWLGATHYHTVDVDPYWSDSYSHIATIGNHMFYC